MATKRISINFKVKIERWLFPIIRFCVFLLSKLRAIGINIDNLKKHIIKSIAKNGLKIKRI